MRIYKPRTRLDVLEKQGRLKYPPLSYPPASKLQTFNALRLESTHAPTLLLRKVVPKHKRGGDSTKL
jgi:hypothetical protein